MAKPQSATAQAAAVIREYLNENHKAYKFSVVSRVYSGGGSVEITAQNINPSAYVKIEEYIKYFEYGYFDGRTDSFVTNNVRKDIPQVKHVFLNNNLTEDYIVKTFSALNEKGIINGPLTDCNIRKEVRAYLCSNHYGEYATITIAY